MSFREEIKALQPTTVDLRKFGWVVGAAFLLIGAFVMWRGHDWGRFLMWVGGPLVVLGTVVPQILRPIYYGWMSFAFVLGSIMTRVILTVFFFLVLLPVGLFFKLIGRDALHRKIDREAPSYWIEKEYLIKDRTRLEKFF